MTDIPPGTWHQCVTQKAYYINHRGGKKESNSRGDKKKLFSTDNNGNISWHLIAVCSKLDVLQKIWELDEDNLTKEEVNNNLFLATDDSEFFTSDVVEKRGKRNLLRNKGKGKGKGVP